MNKYKITLERYRDRAFEEQVGIVIEAVDYDTADDVAHKMAVLLGFNAYTTRAVEDHE